jgi:BlaI family transcriptional regulator, penicillinase repressor
MQALWRKGVEGVQNIIRGGSGGKRPSPLNHAREKKTLTKLTNVRHIGAYNCKNRMSSKVSPAEWEVLNALWDKSPATVPEICQALAGEQDWHPKTVGTFLTRLVKKGMLDAKREGRGNVYSPRKTREQCLRVESASFLKRVFRGSFGPMLCHFIEQAELSPDEIRDLERLLKQKKKS